MAAKPRRTHRPRITTRACIVRTVIVAVVAILLWEIWCAPIPFGRGGKGQMVYGFVTWLMVTFDSARVPWSNSAVSIPVVLCVLFGIGISLLVLLGALYADARYSRINERGTCVHCGHRVSEGHRRLVLCPECGRLPNQRTFLPIGWRRT